MPSSCVISFNENPAAVYFCGQRLSGKAFLLTDKIKAIRGVYITIRGYADVMWSETRSGGAIRRIYFRSHDEYFSSKTEVMSTRNVNRFDLVPGKYEFNFEIDLPYSLPSSFLGRHGEVRYDVILTISRPWHFDNVFKQPFTVISPFDLSTNAFYRQPVDKATKKHFAKILCCGDGGEILVTSHMPHSGFAPGQHIPIDIIIKNHSSTECYEAHLKLVKMVEYRSSTPHNNRKYDSVTMVEHTFGPFEHFDEKSLSCCLRVPPVPPTTFQTCKIIELSYYVDIEIRTKGLHSNINLRLPVAIGTVPLFYGGQLTPHIVSTQPTSSSAKYSRIHTIPEPPSYEEAIRIDADYIMDSDENRNQHTTTKFLPKYPVYYEFDDMILTRRFSTDHHHPLSEIKSRY